MSILDWIFGSPAAAVLPPTPPESANPTILMVLDYLGSAQGAQLNEEILTIVESFYPPAAAASMAPAAIQRLARLAAWSIRSGLATGSIYIGPKGDIISKEWADDPRHQLNPDGTFRF